MHISQVLRLSILALVSTSSALPSVKRSTAQDVVNDIYAIDGGVKALEAHVSSYNTGSFPTSLVNGVPILVDVVDIHVSNRKGYLDAITASTFSNADSLTIVAAVEDTVAVDIPNAVTELKSKKQNFDAAGLTAIVIASLELLKYDHDTFSAAVVQKLTLDPATLAEANAGVAVIHDALVDGISYFEG